MKYLKIYSYTFIAIIISILIIASLSYINVISDYTSYIIKDIILLIIVAISSLFLGKKKEKKGYLEGLKFGSLISLTLLLLRIIIKRNIILKKILFYLLIIISSIFGSIIGINKK